MIRMCRNGRAVMLRVSRCVGCTVWILVCCSVAADETASPDSAETPAQHITAFVNADSAHAAKEAFDKVYGNANQDLLRSLRNGPDDTVAVAVEWKNLFGQRKAQTNKPDQEVTLPPEVLWQFLGFLEGRAQCYLPEWWRRYFYFIYCSPTRTQRRGPSVSLGRSHAGGSRRNVSHGCPGPHD